MACKCDVNGMWCHAVRKHLPLSLKPATLKMEAASYTKTL